MMAILARLVLEDYHTPIRIKFYRLSLLQFKCNFYILSAIELLSIFVASSFYDSLLIVVVDDFCVYIVNNIRPLFSNGIDMAWNHHYRVVVPSLSPISSFANSRPLISYSILNLLICLTSDMETS